MQDKAVKMPHNIILEDRKTLSISGVNDIDSFDDKLVVLFTELGELTIKGINLHINKLNVDTGEVSMDGEIIAIYYNEDKPKKNNKFMSKVFQ